MTGLLHLSMRSLVRNRRRSAVTLGAVAVGVAVVVFAHGFAEGVLRLVVQTTLESRLGAIQIHRKGWLDASEAAPLKLDLPEPAALLAKVRAVPGVTAATARIRFGALLSDGKSSSLVIGEAVDPELERVVCPGRADDVGAGDGTILSAATPRSGVVGRELARAFGARPGATLTVSASGREGGVNALDLEVAGIQRPAATFFESKRSLTVPLAWAQELLQMEGRATEIAVRVGRIEDVQRVAGLIRGALGPDVEVSTWDEVLPFLRDAVARLRIVLTGVSVVLFAIVVFGVVNTMLMNVYERVREIGTMLAVGVRRSQVLVLFLLEAAVLGLVGGVVGAVVGLALTAVAAHVGMPLTPPGTAVAQIIRPVPQPELAVAALVVATLGALAASAWPARKASRMNPVDALRTL